MPRYVILEHDWPEPHLDLFLDAGESLRAWKLPADFSPDLPTTIESSANHRRHYLDYEGAIAGGRGVALRWDFGEFEWVIAEESSPPGPLSEAERGNRKRSIRRPLSASERGPGGGVLRANFAGHQLKGLFEWRADGAGVWHFARVT